MNVAAEFVIEPFVPGRPGAHVRAGIAAVEASGLAVEMGPFGTTVTGPRADVVAALAAMMGAALEAGAERVLVHLVADDR